MRTEVKLCLNLKRWECISPHSKAEVCGGILSVLPLISSVIFPSKLQVSGSLPDSALGIGRVKLWFLVQSYFKIRQGISNKSDDQDSWSSCRKAHCRFAGPGIPSTHKVQTSFYFWISGVGTWCINLARIQSCPLTCIAWKINIP